MDLTNKRRRIVTKDNDNNKKELETCKAIMIKVLEQTIVDPTTRPGLEERDVELFFQKYQKSPEEFKSWFEKVVLVITKVEIYI
jgi:hypothetical protein